MEFPKVYQAAKRFKGAEWALCDALVNEIPGGKVANGALQRCSAELAANGIQLSASYLSDLRGLGSKFPSPSRLGNVTPSMAKEAGTPAILAKAVKVAEADGKPVSFRSIRETRKAAMRPTKHLPQKQRNRAADDQPVSEVRHQANIGKLERAAITAAKAGRDFVGSLAGMEVDAVSRDVLAEDIENVLMVWKAAKQALGGRSISDEAEEFLQTL